MRFVVARLFRGGEFQDAIERLREGQNRRFQLGISGRGLMKNLNFLAAAYIAIWLIFCGYLFSVAKRMGQLKEDIRRLKQNGK
jgi:CcmD family protein